MKPYFLLPLVTLTIGLAVPALAQQEKTTVDAQTIQQLHAIGSKSDEAFKKGMQAPALRSLPKTRFCWSQRDRSKVGRL